MDKDTKIFHLMQKFITFIEEKHARDLVPRKVSYETLREDTLLELKEQQQDEAAFNRFHNEVTLPEHVVQTCQCETLEKARNKLSDRSIKWIEQAQICDWNKDVSFPNCSIDMVMFRAKKGPYVETSAVITEAEADRDNDNVDNK